MNQLLVLLLILLLCSYECTQCLKWSKKKVGKSKSAESPTRVTRPHLNLNCVYRMAQKNGATLSHCKYSENSMTELRENCEFLQYYMLNTVINFLFKNFITLWRHLAKTQLLCDAQVYLYNVNKRQ